MPFIDLKTSAEICKDAEISLKTKFGQAITDLGKGENWLMVNIEGNKAMYFKGQEGNCAIAEIALFGKATDSQYDKMTADICEILSEELNIPVDRIYVKYEEVDHWGYSGFNF